MLITITLAVVLMLSVMVFTTPYFCAMFIRAVFATTKQSPPPGYEEMAQHVTVYNDVEYPSAHGSNQLDIYLPKDTEQPHATILFMHGGGYVGGDKGEVTYLATAMSEKGYAVVSMNYARAPQASYPVPLVQLGEVYAFIKADTRYNLDAENLIFAGSSAGAHCVAQFVTMQTSAAYAELIGSTQTVPAENIAAVLLYCGPYDFETFGTQSNYFMNFMMGRSMWAYFDTFKWSERYGYSATLKHHVTGEFPPTFITDGNTGSFAHDGKELEQTFLNLHVPVVSYFPSIDDEKTGHEFQYDMHTPAGDTVFDQAMLFLDAYSQQP